MPTKFKQALESGKFVVTSEVAPPKGTNLEKFEHHIALLKDKVDAMNVTDHQSSVMRYPSLPLFRKMAYVGVFRITRPGHVFLTRF